MNRLRLLIPAMIACGMAACQSAATSNARDSIAAPAPADTVIPAATAEAARDTAAASAFGLPDTLTIGSTLYRVIPSTQELFEQAPEFRPDTSEAKNIAAQADRVRRQGQQLTFKLANGTEKTLTSNNQTDNEEFSDHQYYGYLPAIKSFVVFRSGYETYDVLLIHEKTGAETVLAGLPQVSPDGKEIIASNTDLVAAFTYNGFEYYTVTAGGIERQYEYSPEKWGPEVIKWLEGKVLVAKFGVMTENSDVIDQYVRLEPVKR